MNKLIKTGFVILALSFGAATQAVAQIKPKESEKKTTTKPGSKTNKTSKSKESTTDSYFNEKGGFKHRLWYGGSGTFNYSAVQGLGQLTVGATPMVGYKIWKGWSAGPRLGGTLMNFKGYSSSNKVLTTNAFLISGGAFTRYKLLPSIFVHAEYEFNYAKVPDIDQNTGLITVDAAGDVIKYSGNWQGHYLGAGYNSSGGGDFGYEILALYDFNIPKESIQSPISFRFGLTYKF